MKPNNQIHNNKHLTLSDRTFIEQELVRGSSFKSIAEVLNKDPTTISKEVKLHRILFHEEHRFFGCRRCRKYKSCKERNACGRLSCKHLCKHCYEFDPPKFCPNYTSWECTQLTKPPYVCNSCTGYNYCPLQKAQYIANKAHKQYEKTLSSSRTGINMTPEELQQLNDLISPLVIKGQPLSHIFAVHSDEIPVCRRTLYNYFDQNAFKAKNIDLPRKVRYKKRKKHPVQRKKTFLQEYRNRRTYVDFEKFSAAFPELGVVEMDTVKGSHNAGKCLLTLLFRSCSFMIIILLPNCTQRSVVNAINNLCDTIGIRTFKKYFELTPIQYRNQKQQEHK